MRDRRSGSDKLLQQSRKERSTVCFYNGKYWDEYWNKRFNDEDRSASKAEAEKRVALIKELFPEVKNFLDVGCGLGAVVSAAREEKLSGWGVDVSQAAVSRAAGNIQEWLKVCNIAKKIPFADNRFQLVTCFDIFEHLYIEEIFKTIREVSRVAEKYILMRSPITGYAGERDIRDQSFRDEDRSHVSVYPWEFWVRQFTKVGKFRFLRALLYQHSDNPDSGEVTDGILVFKKKE